MELFELQEEDLIDQDDGFEDATDLVTESGYALEAIQQSGAEPYERNEARIAQRNGYKELSLKTCVGEIVLKEPQFRDRSFKSCVLINILVWKWP